MIFNLKFHHMGLAVKKEECAISFLKGVGYSIGESVHDSVQNVNLRLCTSNCNPAVELVSAGIGEGPLTPIFKRFNELLYHTCYEVEDLEQCLSSFDKEDLRVLTVAEPKPAILFDGRYVSFYNVMGFGLIELLEK